MAALTSAIIGGVSAAAGLGSAIAGAVGGDSKQISENVSTVDVGDQTRLNALATQDTNQLAALTGMVDQGPGGRDVLAGTEAQRNLAALFGREATTGGLPGQQDIRGAQGFASQIFNPQRVALQQALEQQSRSAARQGALLGRSATDPILRAKLASEQTRQQQMLEAQQGAFSADYANQLQQNRLNLSSQQANILGGLATQALQNRQTLLSLGNQLTQQEREWKLATATRRSRGTQSNEVGAGDRVAAGISSGLSGFSSAMGIGNSFMNMGQNNQMFQQQSAMRSSQLQNQNLQNQILQQQLQPAQQPANRGFSGPGPAGIPGMGAMNQGPMMQSGQFFSRGY